MKASSQTVPGTNGRITIIKDGDKTFLIRAVGIGERYGCEFALTNSKEEMVEFYDYDYNHTSLPCPCPDPSCVSSVKLGQFVSRYYSETILASRGGLDLLSYEEKWKVSAEAMEYVRLALL